jgi:hypothetical protein
MAGNHAQERTIWQAMRDFFDFSSGTGYPRRNSRYIKLMEPFHGARYC